MENVAVLPCVTVDRVRISHSNALIHTAHVMIIISHNLRLYGFPVVIAEITLCWGIMNVCQHMYVAFAPPQYLL